MTSPEPKDARDLREFSHIDRLTAGPEESPPVETCEEGGRYRAPAHCRRTSPRCPLPDAEGASPTASWHDSTVGALKARVRTRGWAQLLAWRVEAIPIDDMATGHS